MTQADWLDGLVITDQSGYFKVEVTDGTTYTCRLRGRLQEEAQASDIAAVGDRVKISLQEDGSGVIESVAERTSALSRAVRTEGVRGAGQPEREQVIIANADQAFFVFAAAQPSPNLRLLDRFLVMGESSRIPKLHIIVNKIDLEDASAIRAIFAPYERIGYRVFYTSARDQLGVSDIQAALKDKISVFTGPSGVGKTSLLNIIQPGLGRTVKDVSRRRQEGMHTTRDSALIKLDMGGYLADTPGLRTLTIWDVEPEELDGYFVEIAPYISQCQFNNCAHGSEPNCAVRSAVDQGNIAPSRYQSYQALRQELEAAYAIT